MKDPEKQLFLLNLFLIKRNPELGGNNSYVGDFSFNFSEIDTAVIPDERDLKDLLDNFKNKLIIFKGNESSIISGYKPKLGVYIINGCYTPQIKILKKELEDQIERDSEKPIIYIFTSRRLIKKDKQKDIQSISITPNQLEMLNNLKGGATKRAATLLSTTVDSFVQIISREKKLLNKAFKNKFGLIDELVVRIKGRGEGSGYKLNSDKFIFKYLKN